MSYRHDPSVRLSAAVMKASGMSTNAISKAIGVPRSTVSLWFDPDRLIKQRTRFSRYSKPCLDCGKMTTGCNGAKKAPDRCAPCFAAYNKVWKREAIIGAIRLFVQRYGDIPTAAEWNPPMARALGRDDFADRFERDGDYPQANIVQTTFGSWNAGIAAAGFTPRPIGHRGPGRAPVESALA